MQFRRSQEIRQRPLSQHRGAAAAAGRGRAGARGRGARGSGRGDKTCVFVGSSRREEGIKIKTVFDVPASAAPAEPVALAAGEAELDGGAATGE